MTEALTIARVSGLGHYVWRDSHPLHTHMSEVTVLVRVHMANMHRPDL